MSLKQAVSKTLHGLRVGFIALTAFQFSVGGSLAGPLQAHEKDFTRTPAAATFHTATPITFRC